MATDTDEQTDSRKKTAWGAPLKEVVVLFDGISYYDPNDDAEKIRDRAVLGSTRGKVVEMSEKEAERHKGLGAVTDDLDSLDAKYARSGQPDPRRLAAASPSQMPMAGPSAEAVRAAQAVAHQPGGTAQRTAAELMRLDLPALRTAAVAFGVVLSEDDDKASLAAKIAGGGTADEAVVHQLRGLRDQVQLDARESGGIGLGVAQVSDEDANREPLEGVAEHEGVSLDEATDILGTGGGERGTSVEDASRSADRGDAGARESGPEGSESRAAQARSRGPIDGSGSRVGRGGRGRG